MKVENRLGKGLSAFFENNKREVPIFNPNTDGTPRGAVIESSTTADTKGNDNMPLDRITNTTTCKTESGSDTSDILYIPLENIQANPNQPRKKFSEEQLRELALSIEKNGVLQPILVRKKAGASFEIVAGERRWRAANFAGIREIPAIVKEFTDKQTFEIGLIENLQRENLSPIEEAGGYKRLILDFNYTQENIAKLVSKSRPHIANMLRLLTLPEKVQKMVNDGYISYTIARTLVGSDNPMKEAKDIIKRNLNVRDVEKIQKKTLSDTYSNQFESELASLKEALERGLRTPVDIKFKNNKGEIIIRFKNLSELDSIITKINKS